MKPLKFDQLLRRKIDRSLKMNVLEKASPLKNLNIPDTLKPHSIKENPVNLPLVGRKFHADHIKENVSLYLV